MKGLQFLDINIFDKINTRTSPTGHKNHGLTSEMLNLNSIRDQLSLNVSREIDMDTLTRCHDLVLGVMFTGQVPVLRDNRGYVFIDRDSKVFRYILQLLHSSSLGPVPKELDGLVDQCQEVLLGPLPWLNDTT